MSNALQIQDELAAALEALDKLDLAFGRVFGLSGLEATDLISHATDLVNEVGEVAHRSPTLAAMAAAACKKANTREMRLSLLADLKTGLDGAIRNNSRARKRWFIRQIQDLQRKLDNS